MEMVLKKVFTKTMMYKNDDAPDFLIKSEDDLKVVSSVSWSSDEVLKIEAEKDIVIGKNVKIQHLEKDEKFVKTYWTVAPSKEKCEDIEYQSAVDAQMVFLDKAKIELDKLSIDKNEEGNPTFDLNGLPSRSRIMVMKKVGDIENVITVKYLFGGIEHTYQKNKTTQQPGNFHCLDLGTYGQMKNQIEEELSTRVPLKKICELIKNSRLSGEPIKEVELGHDDPLTLYTDPSTLNTDCEFLNRFMILLDFEVARRLSIGDVHYNLPVAVGLACMLRIINDSEEDQAMKYLMSGIAMFSGSIKDRQTAVMKVIKDRFEKLKSGTDRAMIHPGNPIELLYHELMNSTGATWEERQ